MPIRIQLSRAKGWRMPPNTVSVARPARWGNPHWDMRRYGAARLVEWFRQSLSGCWSPDSVSALPDQQARWVYDLHTGWIAQIGGHPAERARTELRGKNLACWCAIGQPCHADVLLEVANS